MVSWQKAGDAVLLETVDILKPVDTKFLANTEDITVALSRFGGPLAIYTQSTNTIQVAFWSGKVINSWSCPSKLCPGGLGWTEDQRLIMVSEQTGGIIYVWEEISNGPPNETRLSFNQKILGAVIAGFSVILVGANSTIALIEDLRVDSSLKSMTSTAPISTNPNNVCLLRPLRSSVTGSMEVAVAFQNQGGMVVMEFKRKTVDERTPQFRCLPSKMLVPHPLEDIIASFDMNDRLLVVNMSWKQILYVYDCSLGSNFESNISSLAWCLGSPCYVLVAGWSEAPWSQINCQDDGEDELKFGPGAMAFGFTGAHQTSNAFSDEIVSAVAHVARFSLLSNNDGPSMLSSGNMYRMTALTEMDGAKILLYGNGGLQLQLIRPVSKAIQSVYGIGSVSPGALVLASLEDQRIIASLNEEDITSAAEDLLDCVFFESNIENRTALLRGCQMCLERLPEGSLARSKLSRRFAFVVLFLTGWRKLFDAGVTTATVMEAYAIGLHVLSDRVANLGFLQEAARAIQATHPQEVPHSYRLAVVLRALRQRSPNASSSGDANSLVTKLLTQNKVPHRFGGASSLAVSIPERFNASNIPDKEIFANRKLISLLGLGDHDGAVQLLSASGIDFELRMRGTLALFSIPAASEKVLANPTLETALRVAYKSCGLLDKLERLLLAVSSAKISATGKRTKASRDRGFLLIERGIIFPSNQTRPEQIDVLYNEAAKELSSAGQEFFSTRTKEQLRLSQFQQESKLRQNKSVLESVVEAMASNREDVAEKLRKKFEIQPHLYHKARVRGFGRRGQWLEAARICVNDRETAKYCGVHEVLEMCLDSGNEPQAAVIAAEILADSDAEKARTFARLKMWPETLKFAVISKCMDALEDMTIRCKDSELALQARRALEEIRQNKSSQNQGSSLPTASTLVGFVTGAVRGEPQRCQQQ